MRRIITQGEARNCALSQPAAPAQPGSLLRLRRGGHSGRAELSSKLTDWVCSGRKFLPATRLPATIVTAASPRQRCAACYHNSRCHTGVVATTAIARNTSGTWNVGKQRKVARYIAHSEFCRAMLIQHGLPANKIVAKPHFAPEILPQKKGLGDYAIVVGRLSEEKGILPLVRAWRDLAHIPLHVVGSGPLEHAARDLARQSGSTNISFAGQLATHRRDASGGIHDARFLVAPSRCYETFGMAVLEAMAGGVPAIVPRTGAMRELISDRRTGFHASISTTFNRLSHDLSFGRIASGVPLRNQGDGAGGSAPRSRVLFATKQLQQAGRNLRRGT